MGAERLVAERQILLGVGIEIAEGGRQAVAAMLLGNAVVEFHRRERGRAGRAIAKAAAEQELTGQVLSLTRPQRRSAKDFMRPSHFAFPHN